MLYLLVVLVLGLTQCAVSIDITHQCGSSALIDTLFLMVVQVHGS